MSLVPLSRRMLFTLPKFKILDRSVIKSITHHSIILSCHINMSDHTGDTLEFWKSKGNSYQNSVGTKSVVLIDLSGTLHIENEPTQDAVINLRRLRNTGMKIKFVTNTTKESKKILYDKLIRIGFDLNITEIFTSLTAAANYLTNNDLSANLLIEDCAKEDFIGISSDVDKPQAVVVGLAPSKMNYETLNTAFRQVMEGAKIVAVHKAKYFARKDGLALGPGPFVAALEYATGKQATVIGKPSQDFFMEALKELNCTPAAAIMIGDDVMDDVVGAIATGMTGFLVRTGKYREGDEKKLQSEKSSLVAENFSETVKYILVAKATKKGIPIENTDFDELAVKIRDSTIKDFK